MTTQGSTRRVIVACGFPLLLLAQSALFCFLQFPYDLGAFLLTGLMGLVAFVGASFYLAFERSRAELLVFGIVGATWLAWALLPTRELGAFLRYQVARSKYEVAVAQTAGGGTPACVTTRACESDGATPPYIVFPFEGLLFAWNGVVYVPNENQQPEPDRLRSFSSAASCSPRRLAPHYYFCSFS